MPATPSHIGFITDSWRRAIATTPAVDGRHGKAARVTEDPVETFFDNAADAQVIANARQALLSVERRLFSVTVSGVEEAEALTYLGAVPKAHLTDAGRGFAADVRIAELIIDHGRNASVLKLWG